METQISFSNQEKYPRQGFMQRNALSVKIILIGVLILILLIPLAMIRGLISERSETASEATTEVQNKWSSSQLVTGPFISIPCYENYENQGKESQKLYPYSSRASGYYRKCRNRRTESWFIRYCRI